jgi:hypothetical protein
MSAFAIGLGTHANLVRGKTNNFAIFPRYYRLTEQFVPHQGLPNAFPGGLVDRTAFPENLTYRFCSLVVASHVRMPVGLLAMKQVPRCP